jgi:peptidoglycan/LPS O-acetylase OafA/YrhL
MKYRREIDGVRALAVVPVIFFHAGFSLFSGGFFGVDVFFVVSGYLITTIIVAEMELGAFSLSKFYEKRARRILPALFVMMLITLVAAWFWLLPADFKSYSQTLVAVPLFVSNILFWLTSSYFDTASEFKPLLHTWSLAVEEQYYIFFPIFILLTWKLGRKWIFSLLLLIGTLSILTAQWGSLNTPSFNFYSLITRGFEIIIGALSVFYRPSLKPIAISIHQLASIIGLLLVLYAIFVFDKSTPSPSLFSLIPTIGTALILVFANDKTLVGQLLGHKFFVGIGLISYSAYLWHQPVLAFARLTSSESLNYMTLMALSLSSLLLGYISWKFVETPFRSSSWISLTKFKILIFSFTGVFILVGLCGQITNGLPSRFSDAEQKWVKKYDFNDWYTHVRKDECHLQNIHLIKHASLCHEMKRPLIALWGDSHATALYPGLKKLQEKHDFGIVQLTAYGCPPVSDTDTQTRLNCDKINTQNLLELKEDNPEILILHSAWGEPVYEYSKEELTKKIINTLKLIKRDLPTTKIIIIGPAPRWWISPQHSIFLANSFKSKDIGEIRLNAIKLTEIESLLEKISFSEGVIYISLNTALCNQGGCIAKLNPPYNEFIQVDYGHFSKSGSEYVMDKIKSQMEIDLMKRED